MNEIYKSYCYQTPNSHPQKNNIFIKFTSIISRFNLIICLKLNTLQHTASSREPKEEDDESIAAD